MMSNSTLHRLVEKLDDSQKWMIAAWIVEDGKIKLVDRITHRFPTNDFLAAVGQLASNCHEEKLKCDVAEKLSIPTEQLPSDPLPPVKIFKMPTTHGESVPEGFIDTPANNFIEKSLPVENIVITEVSTNPSVPSSSEQIETPKNENGKTE